MRVLLIDDEENLLVVLADQLSAHGWEVVTASDPNVGLSLLHEVFPDVVVTDLRMENMDGVAVTRAIKEQAPDIPVIVLTAYGELKTAVEAIKAGAVDYLTKPVDEEEFRLSLKRAVLEQSRIRENFYLRDEMSNRLGYGTFVGSSTEAEEVRQKIARAAESDVPIVLHGETGVGKELVARLIHQQSPRTDRPFLTVNCRETSEEYLLEELFGRQRHASSLVKSKLEIAAGGSILLDDLPSLTAELQNCLLHTLRSGFVEPGGKRRPFSVDVRFFVTSNEDLQFAVQEEKLLPDLYHSINVVSIPIPTLMNRIADIPELVQFYVEQYWNGNADCCVSEDALEVLKQHSWPGNVRELFTTLEGARVMSIDGVVKVSDLPSDIVQQSKSGQKSEAFVGLRDKLLAEERRLILQALEQNSNIQFRAAKALGISRSLLNQKIKRLGIELPKE